MTTLTEFLLARFDEDERIGHLVQRSSIGEGRQIRLLAECEAKRRIVRRFEGAIRHPEQECGCTGSPNEHWADVDAWATLCDLATPYADHPAFREEWRS